MDCKNIRLLMHEFLDDPEKMLMEKGIIDIHFQECPGCSSLWSELQQIEKGLFEMDEVELPVDYSTIDWELLAQTETESSESLSMGNLALPKLPNWALALITGFVILTIGVWGFLVLPGFWVSISQGLSIDLGALFTVSPLVNQVIDIIKDIAYWIVLLSTFWEQSLLFVLTNFTEVTVVSGVCFALVIYLLKTRERLVY